MKRIQRLGMICIVLLQALASAQPAAAAPGMAAPLLGATITVTSTGDDISVNGNCTLREAIQAANLDRRVDRCPAGSGTDTIKLDANTYTMLRAGRVEDSNRDGDYDIRSSMAIVGVGMGKTIIELGDIDRAFDGRSTSISVTLQDMTIRNGFTGDGNKPDHGGAVVNRGTMTIRRVQFLENFTTGIVDEMGGAVWNKNKLYVTGSDFTRNNSDSYGGGIGNVGTLIVDTTTFTGNHGYVGGGIFNIETGTVELNKDTKFYANDCGPGAGAAIANYGRLSGKFNYYEDNSDCASGVIYNTGSATLRYSTFQANEAGEGVFYQPAGTLTVSHSYMDSNEAPGSDNGLFTIRGGSVVIDRTTVKGGGATGINLSNAVMRIANSTFTGLRGTWCGAVTCLAGGSDVSLESVTIQGNQVGEGVGALGVLAGTLRVHNTLITGTVGLDGVTPMPDCGVQTGTFISDGYNLVSAADGCGWPAATGDLLGTLATPVDAQLEPLSMNGGPTPTFALRSASAAVNAADPALTVKTDQRMYARPAGPRPDIGAFEYGAVAP